jgi:hypothetical protein
MVVVIERKLSDARPAPHSARRAPGKRRNPAPPQP